MTRHIKYFSRLALCIMVTCWTVSCSAGSGDQGNSWPQITGAPQVSLVAGAPAIHVLNNPGFVVGYDRGRGRAAWVTYRATPVGGFRNMHRPEYQPDPRVDQAAPREIYWGPEYDRGHLAPNYAITQLYGDDAQHAAFYFSNIAPQSQRLNQLLWQRLEEIEIDQLAPQLDTLWVTVGPIYTGSDSKAPIAFFRIWQDRTPDGEWRLMAFRVPQDVRGDERLTEFLVSVDAIEQDTGLDFFSGLPADVEQSLEARIANAERWGFDDYACMPARYRDNWQDRGGIHLNFDRCG